MADFTPEEMQRAFGMFDLKKSGSIQGDQWKEMFAILKFKSKFALTGLNSKLFNELAGEINADGGDPDGKSKAFNSLSSGSEMSAEDVNKAMGFYLKSQLKPEELEFAVEKLGGGSSISLDKFKEAM